MSGPDCMTRLARRSSDFSLRSSRGLAYVEGNVRERQTSPSILSNSSCMDDIPTKPACSASTSISSIRASSRRVGRSSLRVARSSPITAVRMSEWPMNARDVGAERTRLEGLDVFVTGGPRLVAIHRIDDVVAGDGLHPAKQVACLGCVDVDGRQRAGAEHHRRHPVAQRLRERRPAEHFDVVVGVDVEHAGQHPFAGRVDDLRAVGRVEGFGGDRDDVTCPDSDVADSRGRAGAVEPAAVADDRVVAHVVMEQRGTR